MPNITPHPDEHTTLRTTKLAVVGAGAVGSTLAYALADRRVLRPYIGLKPTPEEDFLLGHLSTAPADDPQLCQALTATGVTHVLDFGATTVHTGSIEHPGFQGLQRSPVVRVLAQDGQAALYEVTACGRG